MKEITYKELEKIVQKQPAAFYVGMGLVLTLIVILQMFMTDFMKHINY